MSKITSTRWDKYQRFSVEPTDGFQRTAAGDRIELDSLARGHIVRADAKIRATGMPGLNVNQIKYARRASEPNGKWTPLFPGVFFIVSVDKSDYLCTRSPTRNNSRCGLRTKKEKKWKRGCGRGRWERWKRKRRMTERRKTGGRYERWRMAKKREKRVEEKIRENEAEWHARELTRSVCFPRFVSRGVKQVDISVHM